MGSIGSRGSMGSMGSRESRGSRGEGTDEGENEGVYGEKEEGRIREQRD